MAVAVLFILFIGLAFLSVPIGVAIGVSVLGAIFSSDIISLTYVVRGMANSVDSFTLTAIPFFILAGHIMSSAGISQGLFEAARVTVGRVRGGVMMVTVISCMLFGAISGSAYATVAAIGLIALPELRKQGLSNGASAALIATAGGLGQMIPPSMGLVVYGALNNVSIAKLFTAEIIPGILVGCCFLVYCYIFSVKNKLPQGKKYTIKEKLQVTWKVKASLVMPIIILGGIYSGAFTPTEAAVVAVVYGLVFGMIKKENRIKPKDLPDMFFKSVVTTATILFILGVSSGFGKILALEQVPTRMAAFVLANISSKFMILITLNVLVMFLGTFLDGIAINVILSPILLNIAVQYGISPIHYGVMFIFNATLGLLTPPLGGNLFVAAQICDASFEDVVKNVWPWIIAMLIG
ncbi:TRAP transporter large permease, partial [Clostridium sediminicola]|uniref:TRAP transporter large permease n=1 Tax=Clostridium sediminicola TaxID=3114879 RepID=UPI003D18707F